MTNIEIRPGVGVLALLSSMNYKPWYALAEFVDNALSSYLANRDILEATGQEAVRVAIRFDRGTGTIEIDDDAAGIAGGDVQRAFRPAEPPPDRSGLSQYGIGMKSAACWFGDRFEVTSTAFGEPVRRSVSFDIPQIVQSQREILHVGEESAPLHAHGTSVRVTALHQTAPTGKTVAKIRDYLASIYRHYINNGTLQLYVGGERVAYRLPDFLVSRRWDAAADETPVEWKKDLVFELPSGRVVTGWAGLRARGSTRHAGLALLYRGKVVAGAGQGEELFRPPEIFGASNSFVFQRLTGELDVSDFRVAHTKDAVLWDDEYDDLLGVLRDALDEEPRPLIKMALRYRALEQSTESRDRVAAAVESTMLAASAAIGAAAETESQPDVDMQIAIEEVVEPGEDAAQNVTLVLEGSSPATTFSVLQGNGRTWLRVLESDGFAIEVDRAHPFMRAFAHLPAQEIEPVLRLAAALGLAEIRARAAGVTQASAVRIGVNRLLDAGLAKIVMNDD